MCGIAGIHSLSGDRIRALPRALAVMGELLAHRGPDDAGTWRRDGDSAGFAHRRLSILDLTPRGRQPMVGPNGDVIVHNGEVYNHVELREALAGRWDFVGRSDTEVVLAAYQRHGTECLRHLRGMFAFAIDDGERLFCARDRFGIKPLYYASVGDWFLFASEVKAILPFLPAIETDPTAFAEYMTLQYGLGERTLFQGVRQLLPGHALTVEDGRVKVWRYWDVDYAIDYEHPPDYFHRRLAELMDDSLALHLRSDVPVGAYLSGGVDSSLIAILSARMSGAGGPAFHGKFSVPPGYDESTHACAAAEAAGVALHQVDIAADDFIENIEAVIYHLDYPVAGPGAFPQFMVARLAAEHVKVVLGGQGGDEIFGGYARYLLAYFEQCIKAAIEGTYGSGRFVVTAESIIPNLGVLREYTPLIQQFWRDGLFESLDRRYFRLIDRSADMADEVEWGALDRDGVRGAFAAIFNSRKNVRHEAYFDSMTHFDFKCLLPALLHVEDRVSMAHGLESRVPFLDHPLIEFMATVPADLKFKDGRMKFLIKETFTDAVPPSILNRRDKMGFPVPLSDWLGGPLKEYVNDLFRSQAAQGRPFINARSVTRNLERTARFSRKLWGLMSLELWYRAFHDRHAEFRQLLTREDTLPPVCVSSSA